MHVRLVWADAEGDPEEEKHNRRKQARGGGRQPNTEVFYLRKEESQRLRDRCSVRFCPVFMVAVLRL